MSGLVSPAERLKFLDAVIFNVLICNSDSPAKNYSVLIVLTDPQRWARRHSEHGGRGLSPEESRRHGRALGSLQSAAREFYKRSDITIICGA
ncbi:MULTISPECIES: hypothetical protein [Rhizobium]|uniref:hypothetical protein n=1 Tax=Rhizobium TaxID=379 RepID=UPI0017D15B38|nr:MULTISPECIES: hypothetical protein [Rhizobium]MBB3291274.1 hypothetical protein [Rhizobium sp. BK252]MBB3406015.1 hypothetical protein [Rhizobium sp. BK289]MBB3418612.1 hypothetical protein [Rhizobium sp. BK284]MBB3486490.1 hypothetical protein [Rhizobium sp. BK347]MDK4724239.1 hypothetical protein [Rhizobium sp. CNPSo 3968]